MGSDTVDLWGMRTGRSGDADTEESDDVAILPISQAGLKRMHQQKDDLSNQVAGAAQEMERLRLKHKELEQEKRQLEELTRKQEEYQAAKSEIMESLGRSLIVLEKDQQQAIRVAEVLGETRKLFSIMLADIRHINEETWAEDTFQAELNKAVAIVESARIDYRKAISRVEAVGWSKDSPEERLPVLHPSPGQGGITEKGFLAWLKVGIAVSLPIMVFMLILFIYYLFVTSGALR